jgi:Zn-dependent membrane protease YugP
MESAGITDVEIVEVEGMLSDHYDPSNRRLALSPDNYHGTSLAALGVAAHEAGHAIQHKVGYAMMTFRQTMVPAVQVAAPIAYILLRFRHLSDRLGARRRVAQNCRGGTAGHDGVPVRDAAR